MSLQKLEVLTLFGNYIDVANTEDRQEMIEFLGSQLETVSKVGPNIKELSMEGNPVVERIL